MELLRLKEILKEKRVAGKDLAEAVDVSPNTISRIAKGTSFPSGELLLRIANELKVDVRELFISTKEDKCEALYVQRDGKYISIGEIDLSSAEDG